MSERNYRSLGILIAAGLGIFIAVMVLATSVDTGTVTADTLSADSLRDAASAEEAITSSIPPPAMVLSRMRPRDTVYTTDSIYLEVNLKRQDVTVHFRDGASRTFLVSSGNPYISEGMATPAGLFTVQNKVPMAISRQFNDARLHHWIGVQGGVGFHGLDGSGYYGYLGVRPSSHGCMRMSKEEIAKMYTMVHPGALIMVHNGTPARVVAFCDSTAIHGAEVIDSVAVHRRGLGKERLQTLYDGRFWTDPSPRLVHLAGQRFRWGLEIGDAKRIPQQKVPPITYLPFPRKFIATHRADRSRASVSPVAFAALMREQDSIIATGKEEWSREDSKAEYRE